MGHWTQVSIVSADFLKDNFANSVVKDVGKLINCDLALTAANECSNLYKGWVEVEFQFTSSEDSISVPFLVASENLDCPLIGFNVIEHLIKSEKLNSDIISSNICKSGNLIQI